MKSLSNLSVDLDGLDLYHRIHGLPNGPDAAVIYEQALPRILELCAERDVKATFFVVTSDLDLPVAVEGLRGALAAGHEVASHTHTHPYHLRELSEASIADELDHAAERIKSALGVRPAGFRAPGYNVDGRVLGLLSERGYRYDSSVFSCPPYFAAKTAIMAWMASRGTPSGSAATDPRALLAPIEPYRPSRWSFWQRGDRKHSLPLWELPVGVLRGSRLPVIGTTICGLPPSGARALAHLFKTGRKFAEVAIHAVDLLDERDRDVTPELASKQPDLRRSWPRKAEALGAFLDVLAGTHAPVTLAAVAHELDQQHGNIVIA